MWRINPNDPSELTRIGEPVYTNGEFPVSVHVSPKTGQGTYSYPPFATDAEDR